MLRELAEDVAIYLCAGFSNVYRQLNSACRTGKRSKSDSYEREKERSSTHLFLFSNRCINWRPDFLGPWRESQESQLASKKRHECLSLACILQRGSRAQSYSGNAY